jgi:uncharacterized membrane protein
MVKAMGQWPYTGLYSIVAFATIGWMIWAYARAPMEPLWPGLRVLPAIVLPVSFILLACGLFARNPTLVGADRLLKSPDPARGMIRVTRHPVMWSIMLWSLAHLLARGRHGAVFFGGFLALALSSHCWIAQGAHPGELEAICRGDFLRAVRRDPARAQPFRREGDRLAQPRHRPRALRAVLLVPPSAIRHTSLVTR